MVELRSRLAIGERARKVYDYFRNLPIFEDPDPDAHLFAYRQLALQIALSNPDKGSSLLVTPLSSEPVAQCAALLASSMASVVRKPVLLVDLSEEDRRLADLLGLTSAMYCSTDERSRFFSVSTRWYISTREGIPVGPYASVEEAQTALAEFIKAPDWIKVLKGESWTPAQFALPTQYQNLFFLPPAPARLALIRGAYLGDPEANLARLLDGFYEDFGYVMFYGGSILENSLMLSVIPHVQDVLHAVVENKTRVKDVDAALSTLNTYNAQQLAPILVRASKSPDKVLVSPG